ncbi:MAG: hypothetical protein ACLU90_05590 [Lachnospira sp.]
MEQNLIVSKDMPEQVSGYIEQAIRNIYDEHPHEVKIILLGAASVILGFGAYKEYGLIPKSVVGEED